jgi:titin
MFHSKQKHGFLLRSWLKSWRPAARTVRRPKPRRCHLVLEYLEARTLLNTYTVTNINNAGAGSLRQAILNANAHAGLDTIAFNIPGSGTHIIYPTSSLPTITDRVIIAGDTQPGYNGTPLIMLDGFYAGQTQGLVLHAGGCTVNALWVASFRSDGVAIFSPDNWIYRNVIGNNDGAGVLIDGEDARINLLQGNSIGTNPGGTVAWPNRGGGVVIDRGASGNRVGTALGPFTGNSISGNSTGGLTSGVFILDSGSSGNAVNGNWIGVGGSSGNVALGNDVGVWVGRGAHFNLIGGSGAAGNVISGNRQRGIVLADPGTTENYVQGNLIGTDPAGSAAVPNGTFGIWISGGASSNSIGTGFIHDPWRNVISGNTYSGIIILDATTHSNSVGGNYIGTDATGSRPLGNNEGVVIGLGAYGNGIGGNVISGNRAAGVVLQEGAQSNVVDSNFIGTDGSGTHPLGNAVGVQVISGAHDNTIGDAFGPPFEGNLISGNNSQGVVLRDTDTNNNHVEGNKIGTNFAGTAAVPNGTFGISISDGANNTIGGTTAYARNIISGNNSAGVFLFNGANINLIQGNYIGTAVNGAAPLGNGQAGIGLAAGAHDNWLLNNVVGSNRPGVWLSDSGTSGNTIENNAIGGNAGAGVTIVNSSSNNHVWGNAIGENGGPGVQVGGGVDDVGAIDNDIRFNNIAFNGGLGIDLAGDGATPNHDGFTPGPNNFQNYPVLDAATSDGVSATVTGSLQSPLADTPFALEFFINPSLDPSGYGQGVQYVFTLTGLTTDDDGIAAFAVTFPAGMAGQFVTATATDPQGNTSEFSAGVVIAAAGPGPAPSGRTAAWALAQLEASRWTPATGELPGTYPVAPSLSLLAVRPLPNDVPDPAAVDRFFGGASWRSRRALRHQAAVAVSKVDPFLLGEGAWA